MITEEKIRIIQDKIKSAISQIEKDENVQIKFSGARYNKAFYKTSMTVSTNERNSAVKDTYTRMCKMLGFTQNIVGMRFTGKKGLCEIVDIVTKNRKYPVIAEAPDGRQYKYDVESIKKLIGGDKIINRNANISELLGDN